MDDHALFRLAQAAALASPNRVRQVGAAIRFADGSTPISACNTFPAGIADLDWRHDGDGRFVWMEHAERNVIYAAARSGRALRGATIASTFFPCIDCARAVIQSGCALLITTPPAFDDPIWGASFPRSKSLLEEAGILIQLVVV